MATAAIERCLRCGTKLRNNRAICPCCGLDQNAPPEAEGGAAPAAEAPATKEIRRVSAKAGVKICPACMNSVPEERLVDEGGQRVCSDCAEVIRNKASKRAANPPPSKAPEKK